MESNFGARLRQHRERQGIALGTVATNTKIKASLLEALERGDLSHWPTGLFRRAYVRTYAAAIGLDPDAVVREFLDVFPEPVESSEPPPPPRGLRGLVGSAIGTIARRRTTEDPQPVAAPPGPPLQAAPPAPDALPPPPSRGDVDLLAAARVCTELGRAATANQVQPLLREVARILGAHGLIVWLWDGLAAELRPALAHGYSSRVLAQLAVRRDDDNVTAAAFRAAQTFAVNGTAQASGALAVPLLTPAACAGVLAIELRDGREESGAVRAVATFFAAMLAQLFAGHPEPSEASAARAPDAPLSESVT